MNKQDIVSFTESKIEEYTSQYQLHELAMREASDDKSSEEYKEAKREYQKYAKKALCVSEFLASLDSIAGLLVTTRVTLEQLEDVFSDSYSVEKLTALYRALNASNPVAHSADNSLAEFLRIASEKSFADWSVNDGSKMRTLHGMHVANGTDDGSARPEFHSSGRQWSMCADLLEKLGACERIKLNDKRASSWSADNPIAKRIVEIYS